MTLLRKLKSIVRPDDKGCHLFADAPHCQARKKPKILKERSQVLNRKPAKQKKKRKPKH